MAKTLQSVKVKSQIYVISKNEKLLYPILVYLAALVMMFALPLYHWILAFIWAIIPALAARNNVIFGIIVTALLGVLGFYYLSTVAGMVAMLFLAIILFMVWEHWKLILLMFFTVFLPLIPPPLDILGGFVTLAMIASAYVLGSKRSILLAIFSILVVFIFASASELSPLFFPINFDDINYHVIEEFRIGYKVGIIESFIGIGRALGNIINIEGGLRFGRVLGQIVDNVIMGLLEDTLALQMVLWIIVLFVPVYLTGIIRIKGFPVEAASSLSLLLLIPGYWFIYSLIDKPFPPSIVFFSILPTAVIYYLNKNKITLSKEAQLKRQELATGIPFVKELGGAELDLESIGGYEDVKQELKNAILMPLKSAEIQYAYGLKPAKGLLLFGPPGTGKTLLMNALAREIDYPVLYVKTSDMLSYLYGESERNLAMLFELARKKAPVILFFDEIDMIAKKREGYSQDDPTGRLLTVLLQELDGVKDEKPIIFVGATNVPHLLDPALLRPGRIDKVIYMRPPNKEERKEIFKVHLKDLPHEDIDYDKLAEETERFTGADIANVVKEAKRLAAERALKTNQISPITTQDLLFVIKQVKPSVSLSQLEEYEKFKLEFERRLFGKKESQEEEKITYKDVVDMEDLKEEMRLYIELPLKKPELFEKYGLKSATGLLLFGPPGTGKTYFLRATAGEFGLPMIYLSGADILKEGVEKAAAKIKEAFNRARENAPALVVIDEIDTIAPKRTGSNMLVGQLLQELDGLKGRKGVIFIATTNLPHMLDPALLRPGRIDKIIYVGLPNKEVRKALFEMHLKKYVSPQVIEKLAELTEGYTPADITNIVEHIKKALLKAELSNKTLTDQEIIEIASKVKPSVTPQMIAFYEKFKRELERL
ncbi:MAG: AAA family ATPase [Candidatus Micrarchaeota archaeon]|nr:AAA family ATPase [Candidatus Micrarchaeota archaeon]